MVAVAHLASARLKRFVDGAADAVSPRSRADALAFAKSNISILPAREIDVDRDGVIAMTWSGIEAQKVIIRFLGDGRTSWSSAGEAGRADGRGTLFDVLALIEASGGGCHRIGR